MNNIRLEDIEFGVLGLRRMLLPEDDVMPGDYLKEKFNYMAIIRGFVPIKDDKFSPELQSDRLRCCHAALLDFAESLFDDEDPTLLPYVGITAAYVAKMGDLTHLPRIAALFEQIEQAFAHHFSLEDLGEVKREDYILDLSISQFETYFCAGRLLPFDMPVSQHVHEKVDLTLNQLQVVDFGAQIFCLGMGFKQSFESPHEKIFVSAEKLLLGFYQMRVEELDRRNQEESITPSQIGINLGHVAFISGNLAIDAPTSVLKNCALADFSRTLTDLIYLQDDHVPDLLAEFESLIVEREENVCPEFKRAFTTLQDLYFGVDGSARPARFGSRLVTSCFPV